MPVKPIVRLMPHAVTRPGHRPRRLSLAAGLAAESPGQSQDAHVVAGVGYHAPSLPPV